MNSDSYNYRNSTIPENPWWNELMTDPDNQEVAELMASCELLADLGDEFSWQLVFEIAGRLDGIGAITDYQRGWRKRQSMRKHLLKAMQHG